MRELKHRSILLALAALGGFACVGQLPGEGGPVSDPGPDPDPTPEPEPEPVPEPEPDPLAINVSGQTLSYFPSVIGTPDPIAADLVTQGIAPAIVAASPVDGAYVLANVPPGSLFYVNVTAADNFRPTRNEAVSVVDASLEAPLYAVSEVEALRQYASAGNVVEQPNTAIVVIDLLRNNGMPLEGIDTAAITLTDGLKQPVDLIPATQGPFFIAGTGQDVDPAQLTSVAVGGKARAVLLNVPAGNYIVSVAYLNGQGQPTQSLTPMTTLAAGATLVKSGGMGGGGGKLDPTFTNDVFPLLQRASAGGDACANCHTAGGGPIVYDAPDAAAVHAAILAAGLIDLDVPEDSLLLTKPLYEDPPNHPNATYPSITYPSYVTILDWIAAGAPL